MLNDLKCSKKNLKCSKIILTKFFKLMVSIKKIVNHYTERWDLIGFEDYFKKIKI